MATDSTSKLWGPFAAILLLICGGCSGGDDGAAHGSNGPSALNAPAEPLTPPSDPITSNGEKPPAAEPVPPQPPLDTRTLAFLLMGQSNCAGHGAVPYEAHASDAWFLRRDDGVRLPLADPVGVSLRNDATFSFVPRYAQALRDGGETRRLLFLPSCVDSTGSAEWALAIDSTDHHSTLTGFAEQRLDQALADPNVVVGGVIVYQGEYDSLSEAAASLHAVHWRAIDADVAKHVGARWAKSVHYWHVRLPAPAATLPPTWVAWSTVQTQQQGLADAITHVVQAPYRYNSIHLDTDSDGSGLRKLALDLAADWLTSR